MAAGVELKVSAAIVVSVAVSFAAYAGASVLAPLSVALFVIGIVWPMQRTLQTCMPKLVSLAITLIVTITVCVAFASLAVWGFGRVGRSLVADMPRYQTMYETLARWLDSHGVSIAGVWAEHFNVAWLLRATQHIAERINVTLRFWFIAIIYVMLGLLEVDEMRRRIEALSNDEVRHLLLHGSAAVAIKFRTYLIIRTQMSALTGLLVGGFAWVTGLRFPVEWGVIAFVLNYIPFIGPFIATLFPTLLAMTYFDSWQAVLGAFIGLNVIQFIVSSYIEPRVSGGVLSISPFVVLFAIFFWTFLWGLIGAFIGVPITLAALTFCSQHPSSRWVSALLGGNEQKKMLKRYNS
jgi:AI-2 transport protein TqsA